MDIIDIGAAVQKVRQQISDPSSGIGGALSATYVPKWQANTAYSAGASVVNPSGEMVTAKASFTSGTTYSAANWNSATINGTPAASQSDAIVWALIFGGN